MLTLAILAQLLLPPVVPPPPPLPRSSSTELLPEVKCTANESARLYKHQMSAAALAYEISEHCFEQSASALLDDEDLKFRMKETLRSLSYKMIISGRQSQKR